MRSLVDVDIRRAVVVAVLAAAVLATAGSAGAAEIQLQKLTRKTRKEVSFSLAEALPAGRTFAIVQVTRNGQPGQAPPNMKLDPRTGAFSWTPTESQAGLYTVTFLVKDAAGKDSRPARQITVETPPITSGRDEVAVLLRTWHAAGTAAGNIGDFYDNRDGGHSPLRLTRFPQLDRVEYTDEMKKRRLHWGAQVRMFFKHVTIGNSSTASSASRSGSNTRMCLASARTAEILYTQYRRSHLYVYPEHRDYDPGHNGRGDAYGDLFPANTPYVLTSQGSSGSDRVFLRAVAYTLAAFRPEVKRLLRQSGLLMPTVQMIFRFCNKGVQSDKAYLTGIAHPPVFVGARIDMVKMVKMAHGITADVLPPMIRLAVVEEDRASVGRDYFDVFESEKLFDTPAAVARIARSTKRVRRMVITTKGSADLRRRPLTYQWAILQGDPALITIKPLNADKSVVELQIAYHRRRPVRDGSPMESNRVDIGAFVHNGTYYSAPGFISVQFLDNEARTYDAKGRILEVDYGHATCRIGWHRYLDRGGDITDYLALLKLVSAGKTSLATTLLRKQFTPAEAEALRQVAAELAADPKAAAVILHRRRDALKASALVRIEDAVNAVKNDVNFYFRNARSIDSLRKKADTSRSAACLKAVSQLRALAAAPAGGARRPASRPFPDDLEPGRGGLMASRRNQIERLNVAILQSVVYPGILNWRGRSNFVSPRIATPKTWRDVYRYDPAGHLIGWTRHRGTKTEQFAASGAVVIETDRLGRALVAQTVRYLLDRTAKTRSLTQQPGDMVFHYKYSSDKDMIGRIHKTEKR